MILFLLFQCDMVSLGWGCGGGYLGEGYSFLGVCMWLLGITRIGGLVPGTIGWGVRCGLGLVCVIY